MWFVTCMCVYSVCVWGMYRYIDGNSGVCVMYVFWGYVVYFFETYVFVCDLCFVYFCLNIIFLVKIFIIILFKRFSFLF